VPDLSHPRADDAGEPVAAVDLGTQTALMLVARQRGAELEVLEDHCFGCGLGRGQSTGGELHPESVERTLEVLETFARRARESGVPRERQRAVGTAVLRRARPLEPFLEAVRERTGWSLEVLDEVEEARLGWSAAVSAGAAPETCVIDVGGGSSECVTDAGRSRRSIPMGAVVLTERYLGLDGRSPAESGGFEALVAAARSRASELPTAGAASVVLLGGTASNLACLELGLEVFDHRLAEGAEVPAAAALTWARRIVELDEEERLDLPIEPDRAAILPAGLVALGAVLEHVAGADARARVTGRGLRYGLARELLGLD
jgi:exopolyphosphatase/guanosine-5'-triphosphate,3'-diphosphate pyrophosphatase